MPKTEELATRSLLPCDTGDRGTAVAHGPVADKRCTSAPPCSSSSKGPTHCALADMLNAVLLSRLPRRHLLWGTSLIASLHDAKLAHIGRGRSCHLQVVVLQA